jgi:hypothetical protein
MMASLRFLSSPDVFAYWGAAGLVYGLVLARQRSLDGVRQAFLLTFALIGLAWYAFGSIGWPRYAFPALAVTTIFVAKLLRDLLYALQTEGQPRTADRALRPARALAVLLVLAFAIGYPLQNQVRAIVRPADRSPQLTAAYLDANVPQSDVVETWEPELGVLTDHRYHYPPTGWLDRAVRNQWLSSAAPATGYDPLAYAQPSYLVVGRFGKYTGIYAEALARLGTRPVASFGDYDIYRVR